MIEAEELEKSVEVASILIESGSKKPTSIEIFQEQADHESSVIDLRMGAQKLPKNLIKLILVCVFVPILFGGKYFFLVSIPLIILLFILFINVFDEDNQKNLDIRVEKAIYQLDQMIGNFWSKLLHKQVVDVEKKKKKDPKSVIKEENLPLFSSNVKVLGEEIPLAFPTEQNMPAGTRSIEGILETAPIPDVSIEGASDEKTTKVLLKQKPITKKTETRSYNEIRKSEDSIFSIFKSKPRGR